MLPHWLQPASQPATGVGCHFLLQRVYPTQELNLHSCIDRQILYHWTTREAICNYRLVIFLIQSTQILLIICVNVNRYKNITLKKFFVLSLAACLGKLKYAAKSLQSCPTLCDPIDGSPPGSFVPGILQARTLEWVRYS